MSAHFCLTCHRCGRPCPLCGTCACPKGQDNFSAFPIVYEPLSGYKAKLRAAINTKLEIAERTLTTPHDGTIDAWLNRIGAEHQRNTLQWMLLEIDL